MERQESAGAAGAFCPSAQPDMPEAIVLGVFVDKSDGPRLRYLNERAPLSDDIVARAGPEPTNVLRVAARCEERRCSHFDGRNCQLATRVATLLDPVVDRLPPCAIRRDCRWFAQERDSACLRCPQIVTATANANERYRRIALG